MHKLIDRNTGVEIFVADDRVEEYLEAGHTLPDAPPKAEDKPKPKRKKSSKKEG